MTMAETEESLKTQLSEMETQLRELAYLTPLTPDLKKLKADLEELYSLREQQLLNLKKKALIDTVQDMQAEDIAREEQEVGDSLNESLIGQYCAVPYWSMSGIMHIQNAVICGVEPARGGVRVLIATPTHPGDLPCSKFLNDDEDMDEICGLKGASCRRSHGRFVAADELGEYQPPDWSKVNQGDLCLVKLDGRQLWVHAVLEGVEDDCTATLCLRNAIDGQKMVNLPLEKVLPLITEQDDDGSLVGEDEDEEDEEVAPRSVDVEPPSWEAHSRGVASRIMAAMGFRPGQGLGARGQGIVEPVTIEVLPAGASLDRVMQLRERRRARQAAKAAKASSGGATVKKKVHFDFLNTALSAPSSSYNASEAPAPPVPTLSSKSLANSSQQEIGKLLYAKEKEVAELEKHATRLRSLLSRVSSHQATRMELTRVQSDLERCRGELRLIERHKKERQDKKKLRIF